MKQVINTSICFLLPTVTILTACEKTISRCRPLLPADPTGKIKTYKSVTTGADLYRARTVYTY